MRSPVPLLAGILAIAGLDGYAVAGGPLAPLALLAIGALFVLGYSHPSGERTLPFERRAAKTREDFALAASPMTSRDWIAAGTIAAASFALSFARYWFPPGQIFDEVYFARAGEEYLRNQRIYENTHPPLTKLLIAASMWLLGGLHSGDTAAGWRFFDVVFSSLAVVVLYLLARRIAGSTIFASIAAALLTLDGMHFVQSRIATPEGIVVLFSLCTTYALLRYATAPAGDRSAGLWLALFGVAAGCLIGSKWYGATQLGLLALAVSWRNGPTLRAALRFGGALAIVAAVYSLVWVPDLVRQSPDPGEIHTIGDVVSRQYDMFHYHETLRATHPYASKWWEWPLDYVPVVYYYDPDPQATPANPQGCCVREVTSLPNPLNLWLGLLSVPAIAWLAWRERNAGYAAIVLTYLFQWLPWSLSPRISWEYHYYVDIPIVCACNALALQRLYAWLKTRDPRAGLVAPMAVACAVAAVAGAFAYFYPVLAGVPITWQSWHDRMWFPTWIIGPG